jgi:hypothetical protein
MKIAIIGKGTSAIITALTCIKFNHKVSIFYDPEISHIDVGESTTPHIQKLVLDALGLSIHELVDMGIYSYKMGINFVNWGSGESFHHNFSNNNIGTHFNTQSFNKFINDYLKDNNFVKYFPEKVEVLNLNDDYVEINDNNIFDFVIDCSGWVSNSSEIEYHEPVFESVNSVLLFKEELTEYTEILHTLHLATEDGWQFGLPFPKQNILKCGYLYNNKYISEEEVKNKNPKDYKNKFSWEPRYAKELLQHSRFALNGNKLFFLEPLQALSLYYTSLFAKFICQYLSEDLSYENFKNINSKYLYEMWAYQISLAYHYNFGSTHKSEFWDKTQSNAETFLKYTFNNLDSTFIQNLEYDFQSFKRDPHFKVSASSIGCFSFQDHQQLLAGMSGMKEKFIM